MNLSKKVIAALVVICMFAAYFIPVKMFKVFAEGSYTLTFVIDANAEQSHTLVKFDDKRIKIDNQIVEIRNSSEAAIGVVTEKTDGSIEITVSDGTEGKLNFNTANKYSLYNTNGHTKINANAVVNSSMVIQIEDYTEEQQPGTNGQFNTSGKIVASGAEGTYQSGDKTGSYAESYIHAAFSINQGDVKETEDPTNPPASTTYDLEWNQNNGDESVTINFRSIMEWKYVGKVVVNNTEYNVPDFSDFETYMAHQHGQELIFDVIVPKVNDGIYNVVVKMEPATMLVGNFLWTNNSAISQSDDYIGNSTIELVKVEYKKQGQTVTKKFSEFNDEGEQESGPNRYSHNYSTGDNYVQLSKTSKVDGAAVTYDEASMTVAKDTKVTLKITPKYGYQVTAFTINGQDVVTDENVSEFTFTIHAGNQHIGAKVTPVADEVKSTVSAVKADNSNVTLGEGTLTTGTARVDITDKELSAEKQSMFDEEVAKLGDDYEIASVFDVKLNQVFFKGNSGSDAWYGDSLEDLATAASLGLGADESINMDGAVLVHNIHDGDEMETIEARGGDTSKNQKLYPVDTFSTYALVVKKSAQSSTTVDDVTKDEPKTSSTPSTGDTIIASFAAFALAGVSLMFVKRAKTASKIERRYKK